MDKPLIVVTGATGKTGRLLAARLAARGDVRVRAAVRSIDRARLLLGADVELAEMDYSRPASVRRALEGAHKLYLVTPGGAEQVEQTWVATEAARDAGVQHIVRLGTLLPGRGPEIQVERWCHMTEQMVVRSGIAWTFLRPTWFDQNFTEAMFAPAVQLGLILAPLGDGRAAWVDCRDVAASAEAVLTQPGHEGRAYTLTGPEVLGLREICKQLSLAAQRPVRYLEIPGGPQRVLATLAGLGKRDVDAISELLAKLADEHLTEVTSDVERLTGHRPIAFAQFAADHAAQLR